MAEMIARFKPGQNVPVLTTAAVAAGRFVAVSGAKSASGDYSVAYPSAGAAVFGVAERSTIAPASATGLNDWRRRTNIVRRGAIARVTAAGAITAGGPVKTDATGQAVAQGGTGVIVGYAMNTVTSGQVVEVDLL